VTNWPIEVRTLTPNSFSADVKLTLYEVMELCNVAECFRSLWETTWRVPAEKLGSNVGYP